MTLSFPADGFYKLCDYLTLNFVKFIVKNLDQIHHRSMMVVMLKFVADSSLLTHVVYRNRQSDFNTVLPHGLII